MDLVYLAAMGVLGGLLYGLIAVCDALGADTRRTRPAGAAPAPASTPLSPMSSKSSMSPSSGGRS